MSRRNPAKGKLGSLGFTLLELLVAMSIFSLVVVTFTIFFKQSLFGYLDTQTNALALNDLYVKTARLTTVLRGVTEITSAEDSELTAYAYFNPNDTYVSKLHYYLDTSGGVTQLKVDMTPMTADPPIGTPITSKQKTFLITDNFYQPPSSQLFTYLGTNDQPITTPISDTQPIMSVKVNLAVKTRTGKIFSTELRATLRNKVL